MAIYLITGNPGHGKTLYAVSRFVAKLQVQTEKQTGVERPVYQTGIKELRLPWFDLEDPLKWYECPAGSIIVMDECQKVFRTRPPGSVVPRAVSEFETHRHHGFDVVLITQNPGLVDSNIRKLIEQHIHVQRKKWSKGKATVHYFDELVDHPEKGSERTNHRGKLEDIKYRPEDFALYKSAELHTHQKSVPKFFYLVAFAMVFLSITAYFTLSWIFDHTKKGGDLPANLTAKPKITGQQSSVIAGNVNAPKLDQAGYLSDYLKTRAPVIGDKPWTAMRYKDLLSQVTNIPLPQGCAESEDKKRCTCYTNEATIMAIGLEMCRQIVAKGFYLDAVPGVPPDDQALVGGVAPSLLPQQQSAVSVPSVDHGPLVPFSPRPTLGHPLAQHHVGLPHLGQILGMDARSAASP